MAGTARNHGQFVSGVSHLATDLRKDGMIDNKQRSDLVKCAAWANMPLRVPKGSKGFQGFQGLG